MSIRTLAEAKAAARALRSALEALGHGVCHGQALDLVARQNGERNWNALHARLCVEAAPAGSPPFHLHQRVQGHYLKQSFTGEIVALSCDGNTRYKLAIRLDAPVDTVVFDSFSNWRRHIRGVVGRDGRSRHKTADGAPHLIVRS
jgi:hypothetical protein